MLSCISPLFGRSILVWLVNAGSMAVVVAYVFVPIAFLVLRRRNPGMPRPFRVRWPRTVGVTAIVLALGLLSLYLPFSPSSLVWPYEWAMVIGWAAIGGRRLVRERPSEEPKLLRPRPKQVRPESRQAALGETVLAQRDLVATGEEVRERPPRPASAYPTARRSPCPGGCLGRGS